MKAYTVQIGETFDKTLAAHAAERNFSVAALHEHADARVTEGLAAMERGDETAQDEVFARWRTKCR